MKKCPNCGYLVPGAWTECRRCAAPLAFGGTPPPPPSPPAPTPARAPVTVPPARFDDALLPASARPNGHAVHEPLPDRPAGPDTWLPRIDPALVTPAPPPRSRVNTRTIAIGGFALLFVVAVAFTMMPHGHHTANTPTILAPREPYVGIPTSLADVVRIEAESSRHTALSVIISAATPTSALTPGQLESLQPGYQWVEGNVASTTNTMISVASVPGDDVIAVSGTNKDICAFGRWSPSGGATYVTMAHVPTCAATQAPATGWSPIAGGAAQDLPNDLGN